MLKNPSCDGYAVSIAVQYRCLTCECLVFQTWVHKFSSMSL